VVERRASALGRPLLLALAGLTCALCAAGLLGAAVPRWGLLASFAALLAVISAGVWWQPSGVFGRPLLRVLTPWPEVALTFDDGPNPELTPAILDALEAGNHRGTFFVIGQVAEKHPKLLREIVRRGHALGNHSFAHATFTTLASPARLARELRRTGDLIEQSGHPSRYFRAPVGLLSPRVTKAAALAKLETVSWTGSARDGACWSTVEGGLRRLRPHLVPGAILVLHDGRRAGGQPIALSILRDLLPELEGRGLRSVTLDRLLRR
jgi:peptidoglycan/xylan/chitin deacetylase (PgdA/CDA1 family)